MKTEEQIREILAQAEEDLQRAEEMDCENLLGDIVAKATLKAIAKTQISLCKDILEESVIEVRDLSSRRARINNTLRHNLERQNIFNRKIE